MDNVSHSLIGLLTAEAIIGPKDSNRAPIWLTAVLASNAPDLDLLLTSTFFSDKLGYLLHHRGHSHTLPFVPILATIICTLIFSIYAKLGLHKVKVVSLATLCVLLHLFADYWNNYGIHPLWPWNNQWMYGDMVFIVEPWIWTLALPAIFFRCHKLGRWLCAGLWVAIVGLAWAHPIVPRLFALVVSIAGLCLFGLFYRWQRLNQSMVSLALLCLGLIGMSQVSRSIKDDWPQRQNKIISAHPLPANPVCWVVHESELDAVTYRASTYIHSVLPDFMPVDSCPILVKEPTAFVLTSKNVTERQTKLLGQFLAPRAELQALSKDCSFLAALRFMRIPYWKRTDGGWIVGDLRYDRTQELEFAEVLISDNTECPKNIPHWRTPILNALGI